MTYIAIVYNDTMRCARCRGQCQHGTAVRQA